ncbi:uncharacterized protein LOC134813388 [Bolinopsis microptera]|uniref:uncharacterized protein LOC134813388 n=1 Tax=Bolinopsis microptera TaxID=2820187 RepID=UPI00307A91BE
MHDIMGRDKWQSSVEQTIKVSHQIYSLNEDSSAMFTLFGASKCIYFGIPMGMAILGFVLALFGGDAVLAGSVLHLVVALWIFLTYLLWVYGILGFHLNSETQHSTRTLLKYSSQYGCCGIYVRVLRYRPSFRDERRPTAVHPMMETPDSVGNTAVHSAVPSAVPGNSSYVQGVQRSNFITKAWS